MSHRGLPEGHRHSCSLLLEQCLRCVQILRVVGIPVTVLKLLHSRGGCAGVMQVKNNVVLTIFNPWGEKKHLFLHLNCVHRIQN